MSKSTEIKNIREKMNLSGKDMAIKLDTSKRTYENWELGRTKVPGVALVACKLLLKESETDTL